MQPVGDAFARQQKHADAPSILITGARGFVGSRLVLRFAASGIDIKAMSRTRMPDAPHVKYVYADAFDPDSLAHALLGVDIAYYLLHSMEGSKKHWRDFTIREKKQAENFARAAAIAGVKRIIYLGGLVNDSINVSEHMQSRKMVGKILASSGIPVTELRASIIIGNSASSYAMLRYLAERLPVMVCPKWVGSLTQPIAVEDVVTYLFQCMYHEETAGNVYEIGGPDVVSYRDLLYIYGTRIGNTIKIISIPFLTTKLSSYWIDLVTPVKASLARPLIDSLIHDSVVTDNRITKIIPIKPMSVSDAIDAAISTAAKDAGRHDSAKKHQDGRTGHAWNRKILLASLLVMSAIGSSYYWLDTRPDVYEPGWMLASLAWFAVIAFALRFVYYKTRLGYLVAGVLSWLTLGFWLLDNFHVVFQTSLVAGKPEVHMVVRNFVGVGVAVLCIASSHNAFRKVHHAVL